MLHKCEKLGVAFDLSVSGYKLGANLYYPQCILECLLELCHREAGGCGDPEGSIRCFKHCFRNAVG